MNFDWTDDGAREITDMGREPRRLLTTIRSFDSRHREGASKSELVSMLRLIELLLKEHFANEEQYMASIGYTALAAHRRVHRHLMSELGRHMTTFAEPLTDTPYRVMSFLNNWLVCHLSNHEEKHQSFVAMSRRAMRDTF